MTHPYPRPLQPCCLWLPTSRRGSVVILVMIFLVLFTTLALAFTAASSTNLQQARNYQQIQSSSLAAESGLQYMMWRLHGMTIPANEVNQDFLQAVATRLGDCMNGTPNLGGGTVTVAGDAIHVPAIPLDNTGRTFETYIRLTPDGQNLSVEMHGAYAESRRGVRLTVAAQPTVSSIFDYGIASKSRIALSGNATVLGKNNAHEADILSATYSDLTAVDINGNCTLSGDISTSNPDSSISISGNPSIGGQTSMDKIEEHLHIGVGNVDFPEVDPSVFMPYATNIVDSTTKTNGNKTFQNIRIKANTNPVFSGNITLQGVIYIEKPNNVKFTGNLNLIGVIVTDDAGDNAYDANVIDFQGNLSSMGVENLPDTPAFHDIRQMPGSMLLAPGFGAKFTGNFGTINGAMAADKFTFAGNAGGTVAGPIICYSDSDFSLTGNAHLVIDRSKYGKEPPGFTKMTTLAAVADSYSEF